MDTVFFVVCKIYHIIEYVIVWFYRSYGFEGNVTFAKKGFTSAIECRCSFHFRYVINKIVFPSPEAMVINLVSYVFAKKVKSQRSSNTLFFFTDCKLISAHMYFYIRLKS